MGRHSSVARVTDRYSVSRGSTPGGAREFSKILQWNLANIINKWPRKTPTIGKRLFHFIRITHICRLKANRRPKQYHQ